MEESWTDGATARWTEIRDLAVRAEEIGFETVWIPDELFGAQPMALSRFEEAVEIIVPLLRTGHADFEGPFHAARDLEQRPVGPRPGRIPIMIGAKGPKMLGLAARHADIWSWYVEERSDLDEFGPKLAAFEKACVDVGRDPGTAGKSAGIIVEQTAFTGAAEVLGTPIRGSAEEIAEGFRKFAAGGF